MQLAFYLAGEITQGKESIPWVRCASGNVLTRHLLWKTLHKTHIFLILPCYKNNYVFSDLKLGWMTYRSFCNYVTSLHRGWANDLLEIQSSWVCCCGMFFPTTWLGKTMVFFHCGSSCESRAEVLVWLSVHIDQIWKAFQDCVFSYAL